MKNRFKKILLFVSLLFLMTFSALFIYIESYLSETITTPKLIFIPKGSTKSAMSAIKKSGVDLSKLDYEIVKFIGYPQAGWIDLGSSSMSRKEFLTKITSSKAALRSIKLIPGETKENFFEQISKNSDLNTSLLLLSYEKYAPYGDGVIFADSYTIPIGMSEAELIKYLLDISLKRHKKIALKYLKEYGQKEWFEKYITIASIITKEAANIEEMPLISAVIYNRLKKGMKLQMDGTLNYKKFSHKKVTAKMIREDNSTFNTYKHIGLPPYPICAVRVEAIDAAINPADVDFLYFVKEKNGKHAFAKTYKKHLKNIKNSR